MYNVVYIDPDILIMDDLHDIFEREFDYSVTISENEEQPINGAMHFVPKGKYHEVRFSSTKAAFCNHDIAACHQCCCHPILHQAQCTCCQHLFMSG